MIATRQRLAESMTLVISALAAVAGVAGLAIPGLYGDSVLAPAMTGQDLITVATLPALAGALLGVRRGRARATLVWVGLLGYLLYTYTGAAFAYPFNSLFLVYVALFALSLLTLVVALTGIDARAIQARLDRGRPRRAGAVFLGSIALMLVASELGQIVPALVDGTRPALIERSEGAGNFVYVLDLGVVAPLAVLAAVWLWRRSPWGEVLAGIMLVKATTMGLALLAMTWFSVRAGQPLERDLTLAYGSMTICSLGMSLWFFRGGEGEQSLSPPDQAPSRTSSLFTVES